MNEKIQEHEVIKSAVSHTARNYGIDLLRLFAMYLVTVLHVLGQGGILSSAQGSQYMVSWLFEIVAYCAVNCFAIVSGYVSYTEKEKPYRYSRYLSVWLQVVFYSFGINLIYYICKPEVMTTDVLLDSLRPVTTYHYWYFTAYTGVFFMIPWMNKLVRACTQKEMNRFAAILFLLFSCYANYANATKDVFHLSGGYSFLWLAVMYLIGAWMKKCSIPEKVSNTKAIVCLEICVLLTWTIKIFKESSAFVSYVSPTILLVAVCFVVLFSKMQFGSLGKKLIQFFAPAAFGVYLIHVQKTVWSQLMTWRFAYCAQSPVWLLPIQILGNAAFVFILCLLIEKARILLFERFHMNEIVEKAGCWIGRRCIDIFTRKGRKNQ
ncbi:MAG: acyltransferase [Lachnospiraceae bacterium]|nr:acyltransferase [Lachnospiraceae bacterium]